MKTPLSLLFMLTLIAGETNAQAKSTKNDLEAKKVLDAVSNRFKSYTTVQASFTYKVENAAGKVLSAKSGIILMKGARYKLSFGGQEIFCDGSTVWNYDKAANEVTINTLGASAGMITPQKLFSNFYDKDFFYLLIGEKKVRTRLMQEIQLTPVDKSKNFHTVYLLIDKHAKTMYATKVMENAGNRYSYTVNTLKTNMPASDALFVFDKAKFPGVTIEDLR